LVQKAWRYPNIHPLKNPQIKPMNGKILIVYAHDIGYPPRITNHDMLYCFARYSNHLCYYVNAAFGVPKYLKNIKFDLIIFHDLFLSKRSLPRRFKGIYEKSKILKKFTGYRVATVQDEFIQSEKLNELIVEFDIKHIFSVSPPSQWNKIYDGIDRKKVKISQILCGYVEESMIPQIKQLQKEIKERSIDIGYRASFPRFSLGYLNYLKYKIGVVVKEMAKKYDLKVNISNELQDTFLGIEWYKFLLKCKYMLGTEGGASILDKDGSIQKNVFEYRTKHPSADFKEVEKACFKGLDGKFSYSMITPRHFEACMTKTCQILLEGNYNEILKPGIHYVELKKNFSNLDDALSIVKKDKVREKIASRAYKDIVESKKYTYAGFVKEILEKCLGKNYRWLNISTDDLSFYKRNEKREKLIWMYIPVKSFIIMNILYFMPRGLLFRILRFFS